ncbi:hypothetical protein IZ6_06430 [Terrihabitans soli]|uniref:Fimbrial protein n=1 Tax=Terrihabitans soli TaxID=708113 RepID=A0A6S6QTW2_9HYPH|nr:DUF6476 family protein [Terrihabitans soli]BCJ89908.1 hypothetical protein IZ6_06430 [Terrihabitans soli]
MTNSVEDKDDELNPAQARIVRRMRLFVGISTATMALGFLLVMSVIVWRLVKHEPGAAVASGGELRAVLPIGKGQRITDTTSDGKSLFVTVESDNGIQSILVFDAGNLAYRGKIESLTPAP